LKGQIRGIVESFVQDSGDVKEGQRRFGQLFEQALKEGKIKPEQISVKELYDVLCDPERKVDSNDAEQVYEAVQSSAFPYITGKLIGTQVLDAYNLNLGSASELVTEIKIPRTPYELMGFTDVDVPDEVIEGMPYPEGQLDERRVTLKANKAGRIISLTREMILFDQTGEITNRAQTIGQAMGYLEAQTIWQRIQEIAVTFGGFAADSALVYDGTARAMYENDHSAWDDGANANDTLMTTTLGSTGLKEAFSQMMNIKNTKGEYIAFTPTHLLVPTQKYFEALELLKSDRQYDSAENAVNVFKGMLKVLTHPLLSANSAYYWYIGDFKRDFVLGRIWPVETSQQTSTSEAAFTNDIIQRYKVSSFFGVNARDYRHVLRSEATS